MSQAKLNIQAELNLGKIDFNRREILLHSLIMVYCENVERKNVER